MNPAPLVSPRDALDIIFANRNRAYGAYPLRREYPNRLAQALGLLLLLIALALLLPRILAAFQEPPAPVPPEESRVYEPGLPPDIAVPPPPPPPVETPPPPPQHSAVRFVPPDPRPDEQVPEPSSQLTPEQILNTPGVVGAVQTATTDYPEGVPADPPSDWPNAPVEAQIKPDDDIRLPTDVQRLPTFPGGDQALFEFLNRNIRYPARAREIGIQGVAVLSFVVGKDGDISEVSVLKDPGAGCGKEALRVVGAMPRWIPGEANGHPVRVRFTLPVHFRLRD